MPSKQNLGQHKIQCFQNAFKLQCCCSVAQSCLTLQSHRLQPTRLLCPWDSPDKNTGVGCHFLLQSNSLGPHRLQPSRLLCPWNFLGKNTGVGCHSILLCVVYSSFRQQHLFFLKIHTYSQSNPPKTNSFSICLQNNNKNTGSCYFEHLNASH